MKLVQFARGEEIRAGWLDGEEIVDASQLYEHLCQRRGDAVNRDVSRTLTSLTSMIEEGYAEDGWHRLRQLESEYNIDRDAYQAVRIPARDIRFTLPIRPRSFRDFYAFEEHVKTCRARRGLDMVPEWYEIPVFYFSNAGSFCGPGDVICPPARSRELDYELEIACVIGKQGRNVSRSEADEYIAGFVILNDWSARDIQRYEMKVGLGPAKGKDFATSLGPILVTPDEFASSAEKTPDGTRYNLEMAASVNGKQISGGNVKDLHYTFAQMIERASCDATLFELDVIGSGTVGTGCILELGTEVHPWLKAGDVVELSISGLGTLENSVGSRGELTFHIDGKKE